MNEKKFVIGVIVLLLTVAITSIVIGINVYNKNKNYELNANSYEYTEENALKVKEMYNTDNMKQEFIEIAEKISQSIYGKILDGNITSDHALNMKIVEYNKILSTDNWDTLNISFPKKWIGDWFLDEHGFLKFKFENEELEPIWIQDNDVRDYVVLN